MPATFEEHLPARPGHALLCGDVGEIGRSLRDRGWRLSAATADRNLGAEPGACDLAVVRDTLAHEPWPRWYLQRVHRLLRPGGLVLVDEPNRLDLATPGGFGYLAGRAGHELRRRLRSALGRPVGSDRVAAGRRPSASAMRVMLESLRYEVLSLTSCAPGGGRSLLPRVFSPRLTAVARSLPGIADIRVSVDLLAHCDRFERAQGALLETRRRWSAAHPVWVTPRPAEFVPADHAGRTIVVLSPHPDDEVIGAGGAMLKLVRAGARVVCVQATDGSASAALAGRPEGERRQIRLDEAASVAQAMGIAELECWSADNRAFRVDPEWVSRLTARLERERPAIILVPFVTEAHQDHLTLARILSHALRALTTPLEATVLGYEVWSLVPPSFAHDISPLIGELEALLFRYETAMKVDDFAHSCADRALYHGIVLRGAACHVEAFHAVAARDYPALVRTVGQDDDD